MKTGLMGGSFDPVHMGHLRAAEQVMEKLVLDEVVFIPARVSPHKDFRDVTHPSHRLNMLNLSMESHPRFRVCDMDLKRQAPSYTVDTLRSLRESCPSNEYYFMVGIELFASIDTWKDCGEIFRYANFVVIKRPGYGGAISENPIPLALEGSFRYSYGGDGMDVFTHSSSNKLVFMDIDGLRLCSTDIRKLVLDGRSLKSLVPPEVERYIEENGLYRLEEKL